MVIYTCPECGHDILSEILTSMPPIHRDYCPNCGWEHSETEEIIRIPYNKNNYNFKTNFVETILEAPIQPSNILYEGSACAHCLNNPKNGGTGICNCILGNQVIY